ncbi:MAG: permease-like cell division protein FtsX [Vampirovibrionales bacterium]|nr:permease-like cell division protein FtsX [Vampirovibrionales bacterium]
MTSPQHPYSQQQTSGVYRESSPLMDTVATELRITARIFHETWGGIARSGWMNLIIVVTMAAILSIFGVLTAFVVETQLLFDHIGTGFEISAYLKPGTDPVAAQATIMRMPHVEKSQLIPKEKAWEEMRTSLDIRGMDNPLPDAIHVQADDPVSISALSAELQRLNGVDEVYVAKDLLSKVRDTSRLVSFIGIIVALFMGAMTLFVISNTIHLLIEGRSREIEILRMMGVGNWFIRLPLLLQGGLYGLAGAVIAYIPLNVAVFYLQELFARMQFSTSGYSVKVVFIVLLLMGVLVGAGGALVSIRKYLRV